MANTTSHFSGRRVFKKLFFLSFFLGTSLLCVTAPVLASTSAMAVGELEPQSSQTPEVKEATVAQEFSTYYLPIDPVIPLMPGLSKEGDPVDFDSEEGRVAVFESVGEVTPDELKAFYVQTLEALGWQRVFAKNTLAFQREEETLEISWSSAPGQSDGRELVVTFRLVRKESEN